jgi:hypothetical protein
MAEHVVDALGPESEIVHVGSSPLPPTRAAGKAAKQARWLSLRGARASPVPICHEPASSKRDAWPCCNALAAPENARSSS